MIMFFGVSGLDNFWDFAASLMDLRSSAFASGTLQTEASALGWLIAAASFARFGTT